MRRAFDTVRAREWKASKLNPLFAGLCLAMVSTNQFAFTDALSVVGFMCVIVVNAAFGYAINNFADRDIDRLADKSNVFSVMDPRRAAVVVLALCVLGLALMCVFFWGRPEAIALCALSFGLAAAYSMPPLRFKERGWLGVATSALAQRVVPLVAGLVLLRAWNPATVTYVALAMVVGVRFMLIHQIDDAENDRKANVRTLALRFNRQQLENVNLRFVGPLELALIVAVVVTTVTEATITGIAIGASFVLLTLIDVVRRGVRQWYVESNLNYWGFDRFYVIAVPVVLTASILTQSFDCWPVALICLILVVPEIARLVTRLGAVRAATQAQRQLAAEENRWTSRETTQFAHPIGILLFNRPEYAVSMLDSLSQQSAQIDPTKLTIHIDGYPQSHDQARGLSDNTAVVAQLARERFPTARILVSEFNVGIAAAYESVETHVFADDRDEWAVFLEEDFVLYPTYLQTLTHLIAECADQPQVAMLSATGDLAVPDACDSDQLVGMGHSWAYALRRDHALERRALLQPYLDTVTQGPYWMRDKHAIWRACAHAGYFPMGTSQDYVKRAIMLKLGAVALTTARAHGYYVGQTGEHFTPDAFVQHGYDVIPEMPQSSRFDRHHIGENVVKARDEIETMMALIGVTDIVEPLDVAQRVPFTPRRWDVKDSTAALEGPFPELNLPRQFVWLTGRETTIELTVNASAEYEIQVTVTNYHRGQVVTISSGSDQTVAKVPVCTQADPAVISHAAHLTAGANEITIAYSKSRRGSGDTRELGVALIDITL